MSNYLDYKATVWYRIPIKDKKHIPKVIEKLNEGDTPSDIFDHLLEWGDNSLYSEDVENSEEFITPLENNDQPTIEIYKDNKLIWQNKEIYGNKQK